MFLPKYIDLIMKMEASGMMWRQYDSTFRMKRAKKVLRGKSRRLRRWSETDIELYIGCNSQVRSLSSNRAKPSAVVG